MFSYSGLGIKHAAQLRESSEFIYLTRVSCIAALNKNNLKYVITPYLRLLTKRPDKQKVLVGGTNRCIFILAICLFLVLFPTIIFCI